MIPESWGKYEYSSTGYGIILAPPASGKTTFIERSSDPLLQDADDIIAVNPGWPEGRWWLRPEDEVERLNNTFANRLISFLVDEAPADGPTIIFSAGFGASGNELLYNASEFFNFPIVTVIPTYSENVRRLYKRLEEEPERWDVDLDSLAKARRDVADVPVAQYGSFEEAVASIRNAE